MDVAPFVASHYAEPARLAALSAPAYDLIPPEERERLAAADPHAIVHLTLPTFGADDAARRLAQWRAEGELAVDGGPALFLYELAEPGHAPTRGWLAAVSLAGPVAPHEATVAAAVADRQRLRAATAADLEPIVLAHDGDPAEADALARDLAGRAAPVVDLTDGGGVRHRLWRVAAPSDVAAVVADLGRRRAVIADGHHRHAAARAHAAAQAGPGPHDRVLALVVPTASHGLRVQAIHRVLPRTPLAAVAEGAAQGFRVDEGPPPEDADAVLAAAPETLLLVTDGRRWLRLTDPAPGPAVPAAWRGLDVALADVGLGGGAPDVLLRHPVAAAVAEAERTDGVALLLRPTTTATVLDLAARGVLMPRKSTLFVPKPRTGLVLRCFADQPPPSGAGRSAR